MTDKYEDEVIQEEDHENKDENRRGPEKLIYISVQTVCREVLTP